jgi:hypothetical protein
MPSCPLQKCRAPYVAQALKEPVQRTFVYIATLGIAAGLTAEFTVFVGWIAHGIFSSAVRNAS